MSRGGLSTWGTVLCGLVLIAVIAPFSQLLTMGSLDAAMETMAPVPWAVGTVFSLVLGLAVVKFLAGRELIRRENLVLLYCMLSIAAPIMNIGLVRPLHHVITAVAVEYLYFGTSTYRTVYDRQTPDWFPLVPTPEGLAVARAERVLGLLEDPLLPERRAAAGRRLIAAVENGEALPADAAGAPLEDIEQILRREDVRLDETARAELIALRDHLAGQSARAREQLRETVREIEEAVASLLPSYLDGLDPSSANRIRTDFLRRSKAEQERLQGRAEELEARLPVLRELLAELQEVDRLRILAELRRDKEQEQTALSPRALAELRHSFVYRLPRQDRFQLMQMHGADRPNNHLAAMRFGLFQDLTARQEMERRTTWENLREVVRQVPWELWSRPLLLWTTLFFACFLLTMCAAEWFRRKWVDRENLAFPQVEVVDGIIRHDRALEVADDLRDPPARSRPFNALFLAGLAVGAVLLSLEALAHYKIIGEPPILAFNVSQNIFTMGALREMDKVVLVLSPIVIGLLFLVSLEISFSIWVTFFLYKIIVLLPRLAGVDLRDSTFTGYGGGRDYPFVMEQMLGACVVFTLLLILKSWRSGPGTGPGAGGPYVAPRWARAGLILLPLVIFGMLWHLGVSDPVILLLFGVAVAAQTVAAARVRAESGLPTFHTSYEFTKLPMIFGVSATGGGKVFASYLSVVFLPTTLLFRSLSQQLENLELARRFRLRYSVVAWSSLAAFAVALVVGIFSFLILSHYRGESFNGAFVFPGFFPGNNNAHGLAAYPLYVAHFRGESGLATSAGVHWIRVIFIGLGAAVFALLTFLRGRFLGFPLNPLGYMIMLLGVWFAFITPYVRGEASGSGNEVFFLWGGAFAAWLIKKILIKYGGMRMYKQAKPFFIGLVAGSVVAIFAWNLLDLTASLLAEGHAQPGPFLQLFHAAPAFSPRFY